MDIKKALILFLCISSFTALYSQTDTIFGRIVDINGDPIQNSTISSNNKVLSVSGKDGYFSVVSLAQKNKKLSIRSLGFEPFDTLVTAEKAVFLNIVLKDKVFEQEGVEITSQQNLYSQKNWDILNYVIYEEKIILLYIEKRQRKLGVFEFDGTLNNFLDLDENYTEIKVSCTNTLLLLSSKTCVEYVKQFNQLTFLNKYDISLYKKALSTCITKIDNELIFKRHLEFNKRVFYTRFDEPEEEILLYEVVDEAGIMEAKVQLDTILGAYNRDCGGFYATVNLIRDRLWNGDLKQLIISPDVHKKVAYFLSFDMRPANLQEYVYKDSLFIIDFVNRKFIQLDIDSGKTNTYLLEGFDWKEKYELLLDEPNETFYLLSKDDVLQQLEKNNNSLALSTPKQIDFGELIHKNEVIYENKLYYISHNYNARTKFHQIELEE